MIDLRGRVLGVVVGVSAAGLLLAGCSSEPEPAPSPPVASSTPAATPPPTPTPTPTSTGSQIAGTVADLSDPGLGIVFEDVPDLTGDEADVYNWVSTYRLEYWRTLTTNEVSPAFAVFTSADVQAQMQWVAQDNVDRGLTFTGTYHPSVGGIVVTGDTATAVTCDDYREVTVTGPEGPRSAESEGIDVPIRLTHTLARASAGEGTWRIESTASAGTC